MSAKRKPGHIPDPRQLRRAVLTRMKTQYRGRHHLPGSSDATVWDAAFPPTWAQRLFTALSAALEKALHNAKQLSTGLAKLRRSKPVRRPEIATVDQLKATMTEATAERMKVRARHRAPGRSRKLLAFAHRTARQSVPARLPRRLERALAQTLAAGGHITRRHVHPAYRRGTRALPVWTGARA